MFILQTGHKVTHRLFFCYSFLISGSFTVRNLYSGQLLGLLALNGSSAAFEKSLNLGLVVGVGDNVGELLSHLFLGQVVDDIELFPELLFYGHGGAFVEFNKADTEELKNAYSCLVAFVVLKVLEVTLFAKNVSGKGRGSGQTDELLEVSGVFLGHGTGLEGVSVSQTEHVLAVVLPHALEMGLGGNLDGKLMGERKVFLLDDLGEHGVELHPFLGELLAAFFGRGINSEDDISVLICVGERVENSVSLLVVLSVGQHVATISVPGGLGHFVVEES